MDEASRPPYETPSGQALSQGVNIERLVSLPVREAIGRFKYTEEAQLETVYADIMNMLQDQIREELLRKEDF